ncbi:MAG: hypothetical protein QOG15_1328 [Solirubrobacteraceae bacterium]|nr:hypothetical protein [Solirubrobacteraceae bacterium]
MRQPLAKQSRMTEIELDPNLLATLQTLETHAVDYVLVGEVAEAIHNAGGFISQVAVVPGSYGRNVDRLASALKALDAHLPNGQPLNTSLTDLRAESPCTFRTRYADIALDFFPGGTNGYQDLFDDAGRHRLTAGVAPHVASPPDLERMEEWARTSTGGHMPPAVAPAVLPPEPHEYGVDDGIPHARPPAALPPEVDEFAQEIRARRASRASG